MEEQNTNPTQVPETPQQDPGTEGTIFKEKESKVGPLIGSIIVIIVIIIAGIYFWSTQVEEKRMGAENNEMLEQEPFAEEQTNPIEEANQIDGELDLLDTEFDDIDAELEAIDAEFDSL